MNHKVTVFLTDRTCVDVSSDSALQVEDRDDEDTGGEIIELKLLFNSNYLFGYTQSIIPFDAWNTIYGKSKRKVRRHFLTLVKRHGIGWLVPGYDDWQIDLDDLGAHAANIKPIKWAKGLYFARPHVKRRELGQATTKSGRFVYMITLTVFEPRITKEMEERSALMLARQRDGLTPPSQSTPSVSAHDAKVRLGLHVFYCYSHKGEKLSAMLETHLKILERQGLIAGWHDRMIGAGEEWKGAIDRNLEKAQM
jgi:hypothetical protein